MRKRVWLPLIVLYTAYCVSPQKAAGTDFRVTLGLGSFGGGGNVFSNDGSSGLSANLINIFVEHEKTHIGFEVTPLQYTADFRYTPEKWKQNLYFLNGTLYWNPFNIRNIILGPFASINYLGVEDWSRFTTDGYVFNAGLRFLWGMSQPEEEDQWKFLMRIIGIETGYRNSPGKHGFYFNINMDIIVSAVVAIAVAAVALAPEASEAGEANEEYERQINGTGPFVPKEPKPPKPPFQDDKQVQ